MTVSLTARLDRHGCAAAAAPQAKAAVFDGRMAPEAYGKAVSPSLPLRYRKQRQQSLVAEWHRRHKEGQCLPASRCNTASKQRQQTLSEYERKGSVFLPLTPSLGCDTTVNMPHGLLSLQPITAASPCIPPVSLQPTTAASPLASLQARWCMTCGLRPTCSWRR